MKNEPTEIDKSDDTEEELDLDEELLLIQAQLDELNDRNVHLEKTIVMGLKGLVLLVENLEMATSGALDEATKSEARKMVKNVVAQMKTGLSR